jgi:ankyrin repeat protein
MTERVVKQLFEAIEHNDLAVINSLLSKRQVDATVRLAHANNQPALVRAAELGRTAIVELLLNAGARIDDVDSRGESACHIAGYFAQTDVMRVLIAHRPDLTLVNVDGETALQRTLRADSWGGDDAAVLMIQAGASPADVDSDDLCWFATFHADAVQALVDHDVVVSDLRIEGGETPLHMVADEDVEFDAALCSKLVECGVDLEARAWDAGNATCSDIAAEGRNTAALRFFVLAGIDVDAADKDDGEPLLHTAVNGGSVKCMMLLLAAGADVTARNRHGQTACHLAVMSEETMMSSVPLMLAAGADLDAVDSFGQTPREVLAEHELIFTPKEVERARRRIAKMRLDFVRNRAREVCIGLQSLRLDALQLCEILMHACGPLARLIAFHQWWKIATAVKHFRVER